MSILETIKSAHPSLTVKGDSVLNAKGEVVGTVGLYYTGHVSSVETGKRILISSEVGDFSVDVATGDRYLGTEDEIITGSVPIVGHIAQF